MQSAKLFLLCLVASLIGFGPAMADNWPQWRGAAMNGVSSEASAPTQWGKDNNVAWRLPLPGPAGSTPVVWDDRIFLTSANDDNTDLLLMAVDTSGKQLWSHVIAQGNRSVRRDEGNYASPSPCTDGQHVWAMMATGDLVCYTVDGQQVWKKSLQDDYGKFHIQFGMTSTPVLDSGRLYLQLIHGRMRDRSPSEGFVIALDATTGNEIWKHVRKTDGVVECKHSYASPVIYRDNEREYLLIHGADYVTAHHLEDGRELWRCGGFNPKGDYNPTLRFVASPVCSPGMIVVPSAKRGPVYAIRPDVQGDISAQADAFLWKRPRNTPDVPSPLIHDGLVYLCRENGVLICADAQTGKTLYEERTVTDRHRASPVFADGKIYVTARNGTVTVVKAGRTFEVLAKNQLGEPTTASPVVANGRIYLRTYDALYAIGE